MKNIAVLLAGLALVACSSQPTTADLMRQEAKSLEQQVALKNSLAKDLEKGKKLVADGESKVKEGNKILEKGNAQVAEGTKLIEDAKRIYQEKFPESKIEFK